MQSLILKYLITQWALVCFEFVAINVIVEYWTLDLNPAILISVCIVVIGALNLWSVRWYGEAEFWISITKLMLMAGLTLYTFVTMVGGYVDRCDEEGVLTGVAILCMTSTASDSGRHLDPLLVRPVARILCAASLTVFAGPHSRTSLLCPPPASADERL